VVDNEEDGALDPLHAIYGLSASSRPIWLLSCGSDCPLVTVVDREQPLFRGPETAQVTPWVRPGSSIER
jgi:hypothetical protein